MRRGVKPDVVVVDDHQRRYRYDDHLKTNILRVDDFMRWWGTRLTVKIK